MATRLILIRHGQTDWNRQKRYCSFTDVVLNENGKGQARKLIKELRMENVSKVYASDRKRALQFAKIIFKNIPVERVPELREMNFGVFEGLAYQEIMVKFPAIYKKWLKDSLNLIIPGGECLDDLAKRVREALKRILSCNRDRTVVVVTHAGPIKVILCDVLKLGLKRIFKIQPDLACVNIIEFVKGRGRIQYG